MNATADPRAMDVEHSDGVLVLARIFDAPRERVFEAWTQSRHFSKWFGPNGATMPRCTLDLRVGGELHFHMRVPGDEDVWCKGIFREIDPPRRLVFAAYFSDEHGNIVEREGFPYETIIAVTFEDINGGTRVTVRQEGLLVDQGEVQGWREGFERLDALLDDLANHDESTRRRSP